MKRLTMKQETPTGYVVGNAAFSAEVTPSGRLFRNIHINPSYYERYNPITEAGEAGFAFKAGNACRRDASMHWTVEENDYPRYRAHARITRDVAVDVCAFAPVTPGDNFDLFLPAILTVLTFQNRAETEQRVTVTFQWRVGDDLAFPEMCDGTADLRFEKKVAVLRSGCSFLAFSGANAAEGACLDRRTHHYSLSAEYVIAPNASLRCASWFGTFSDNCKWRTRLRDEMALCRYIADQTDRLQSGVQALIDAVPDIGDPVIKRYTRWYMQAAILLTKGTADGQVITMGYHELNQRDSYWTSFAHLVLWPDIEKDIIRTSIRWQRVDGKLPTTVLPMIERDYDIDINEYFCLRIARYYHFHRDVGFLRECYAPFRRAVDFLIGFDRDGDGIPEQDVPANRESFWGDWKDVSYIQGRKLAPHFCLLWLAVLREGAALARVMHDGETADLYDRLYEKAASRIHADFTGDPATSGLWDHDHYTEVWYDGRHIESVLQDQTVGTLFGVIPQEHQTKLYTALSRSECPYGIRETFPYRVGKEVHDGPGMYHNGGVWPWLMFCDTMGRYQNNRAEEAEVLIRRLGYYDLELPGDYRPNEFLSGETGENHGLEVQGWSAALFGTLYFGAFGFDYPTPNTLRITVRIPARDFSTRLVLPAGLGIITVKRRRGVLKCTQPENHAMRVVLTDNSKQ